MPETIFSGWTPEHTAGWNRHTMSLPHSLHRNPLFGLDALAELIDRYPREGYALVHTSRTGISGAGRHRWREGEIAGVPGRQVIDMVEAGTMWLNLRDVGRHSPAHAELMKSAYAEMIAYVPGFDPQAIKMGILISSPSAQVPYHCDLPGQALWQIRGCKRVSVYPARAPYLEPEALENIAYSGFEFKLGYRPEFDAAAEVFELEPGGMLTWPLNSPHRVDNHGCLNISVTTEHWTGANRRMQRMLLANGVLRNHFHLRPASRGLDGPAYWAKAALQAAWRRSPWAASTQRAHRPVEFRLDPGAPDGVADLPCAG